MLRLALLSLLLWAGSPLLPSPAAAQGGPFLFVFNTGSDDVTIIDPATNQVLGTRPVGFKVKRLADHMQSFDGTLLWTYGLRTEKIGRDEVLKVDVVGFDPVALRVVKRQEVGKGPAHSRANLVALPEARADGTSAFGEKGCGRCLRAAGRSSSA